MSRRGHKRTEVRFPVRYLEMRTRQPIYSYAIVSNFSKRGLLLVTRRFHRLDTGLMLGFSLPFHSGPLRAISRVTRVNNREESDLFFIGSEFSAFTSEECEVINRQLMPLRPTSKSTLRLQQ